MLTKTMTNTNPRLLDLSWISSNFGSHDLVVGILSETGYRHPPPQPQALNKKVGAVFTASLDQGPPVLLCRQKFVDAAHVRGL